MPSHHGAITAVAAYSRIASRSLFSVDRLTDQEVTVIQRQKSNLINISTLMGLSCQLLGLYIWYVN